MRLSDLESETNSHAADCICMLCEDLRARCKARIRIDEIRVDSRRYAEGEFTPWYIAMMKSQLAK